MFSLSLVTTPLLPFVFLACTQKASDATVSELKDEIAALKAEILLLKSALAEMNATTKQDNTARTDPEPCGVTVSRQVRMQEDSNATNRDQRSSSGSRMLVGLHKRRLMVSRLVATLSLVVELVHHKKEQERSGAQ